MPTPAVKMYTTKVSPYSEMATRLLKSRGVESIENVWVDADPALRDDMFKKTNSRTTPQIFIGDFHVGGFDNLAKLDREGKLRGLLGFDA